MEFEKDLDFFLKYYQPLSLGEIDDVKLFLAKKYYHDVEYDAIRNLVLDEGKRLDGRTTTQIRPIWSATARARARHNPSKLKANGPIASTINVIIFFYFLVWTPSSISFMTDAVLIFYGVSMWLAAIRGYAGCEALAIAHGSLKSGQGSQIRVRSRYDRDADSYN